MSKRRKSSGAAGRSNRSALPFILVIIVAGAALGYWFGVRNSAPQEPPRNQITVTTPKFDPTKNDVTSGQQTVPVDPKKDPIRQAVEAQLAATGSGGHSAFPAGTKLVNLSVHDGTAVLELSPEFKAVNNSGDTVESLAYNGLRNVLAQFPTVKYMRVLVNGKVFEGEHSGEWAEVNVRDGNARVEEKP